MSDDLVKRLDNLWAMLEEEGYYVKANTVTLAKDRIEQLERELHLAHTCLDATKDKAEAVIIDLMSKLTKAVEALRFYASESGYEVEVTDYGCSLQYGPTVLDAGEKARNVLAKI
jgi:hypothetical protein